MVSSKVSSKVSSRASSSDASPAAGDGVGASMTKSADATASATENAGSGSGSGSARRQRWARLARQGPPPRVLQWLRARSRALPPPPQAPTPALPGPQARAVRPATPWPPVGSRQSSPAPRALRGRRQARGIHDIHRSEIVDPAHDGFRACHDFGLHRRRRRATAGVPATARSDVAADVTADVTADVAADVCGGHRHRSSLRRLPATW